ncbi:hypothetical protein ACFYXM_34035 [Streptomyces sp. NPDC002476]|uniref:hypothetical protein n=1 Tax=Streptomyces sp. NPDC002476 TaxID=3364648 RepID=UPI00367E4611
MNEFYDSLTEPERDSAQDVALKYARELYGGYERLLSTKVASTSPYYVGLSSELGSFTHVTRRVVLVTDTMLLSDHGVGTVHELGVYQQSSTHRVMGGDVGDLTTTVSKKVGHRTGQVAVRPVLTTRRRAEKRKKACTSPAGAGEVQALTRRATELEQQILDLRAELAERDEDLAAARAANRELMAQLNRWLPM